MNHQAGWPRRLVAIVGGTAVSQFVILLSSPILTRLFGTAQFGQLAVLTALAIVVGNFASLKFELAIPVAAVTEIRSLVVLGLGSAVACCSVVTIGWHYVGSAVHDRLLGADLPIFGITLGLSSLVVAGSNVASRVLIRVGRYRTLAIRNATQGAAQVVFQISSGWAGLGTQGLLAGFLVGRTVGVLGLVVPPPEVSRQCAQKSLRFVLNRYRRFPLVLSWSSLLNSLGLHGPILIFGYGYSTAVLGAFALAQRVVGAPVQLVSQNVDDLLQGAAGELIREKRPGLSRLITRSVWGTLLVIVIPAVILFVSAPLLFGVVFGKQWVAAGMFCRVLVPAVVLQLACSPIAGILAALECHGRRSAWELVRALATCGVVLGAVVAQVDAHSAVIGLAISHGVSYALLFCLVMEAGVNYDRKVTNVVTV